MTDYKNTLNLPKTDFPMKANLAQRENDILKKWDTIALYDKMREQGKNRKKFIFHDGPPYANGQLHIGHSVNKVLKDIVTKAKTLSGYDAPLIPGWDCHGLPIELNVEKKIGKPGQKVTAHEFRKACREFANSQINIQREQLKRLGIIANWVHPYLTMDPSYEANILRSLGKIIKNGHLQKGAKPVYWCLDCASPLAEAEVEYEEKLSPAIDVRFKVTDQNAFLACFLEKYQLQGPISIPIWTTTPWTLPANQAVAINPLVEYALVQCSDECLVIAEPLIETVMQRYGIKEYHILGKVLGEKLEHIQLQHPFYARQVPLILGDHVTVDAGTGAVHTAPAHGVDDYVIGKKYHLPMDNPVGDDGCFVANTILFAGLHVNKANDKIIDELKNQHALLHFDKVTHSYPHCWRHKTPLIFRATPQWFISMEQNNLRDMTLKAINQVKWIPEIGQNRIYTMMENRPDWCISRQRAWGVPIALFIHKETGELHPNTLELIEEVAKRFEKEGIEAWYTLDEKALLGADATNYRKNTDILDVWFDSGVSHECVLKTRPELGFPADLYLEGSDQHRGWFNSSLTTSVAMNNQAPYKAVLTHGYTLDDKGRKMSKSLGNVIPAEKITQTLGADILRLWVSAIDYKGDVLVSDEVFSRTSETYRRIRNTARFLLANLEGFDPKDNIVSVENMLALDRWVTDKARILQEEIIKAYDAYQFHLVYQKIHQFCSIDLGGFYLDIVKDRQYTTQTNSLARRSTQTALYHIAEALVRWLAPILSFTAEELWQYIPGERNESVFLNTWYTQLPFLPDDEKMNSSYWETIRLVRDAVNKEIETVRNAGKIGSALEANVILYCEPELKSQLDELQDELRFILITSGVEVHLANVLENAKLVDTRLKNSADLKLTDLKSENSNLQPAQIVKTDFPGLWVKVLPLSFIKCERCWHRCANVGENVKHPTLCLRCVENVEGVGEIRKFA
ncbi:MAG: isoleucine--tRNA ligase [Gammaproteobacteria bacterium]|nr:isoleucine--tRNA ligase [Gammaproteobacteria bacterium]